MVAKKIVAGYFCGRVALHSSIFERRFADALGVYTNSSGAGRSIPSWSRYAAAESISAPYRLGYHIVGRNNPKFSAAITLMF